MADRSIREICKERALKGEGAYAIAAAIFDLSDSQEATAAALQRLGFGNASTNFGAIEGLSMQIVKAAEVLGEHIESAASSLNRDQ